jgi:hypothetical protein
MREIRPSRQNHPKQIEQHRAEHNWKYRVLPKLAVNWNYSIKFDEKIAGKCGRGAAYFAL